MNLLFRLFRPSARAYFEEGRREGLSWTDLLHGYIYGRWAYLYIGVGTGELKLAAILLLPLLLLLNLHRPMRPAPGSTKPSFADSYHGKPLPLAEATRLVTVNRPVEARNLEHVVPYALARDIVLKNPERILLLDCPCRSARKDPCLPLSVCLIVGEPFASFMHDHHPDKSRMITPEQAVEVLRESDARGHVHHAFFKDVMLGRFYAICNCCACCCGAMQAQRHGLPMLCSSGYLNRVDAELCEGCGQCLEYCQFKALTVRSRKAVVDADKCFGCGVCVSKCPRGALSLERAPEKGEPLEVARILDGTGDGKGTAPR